jgi:uncharacterized coiled-coil DUF342 family protein
MTCNEREFVRVRSVLPDELLSDERCQRVNEQFERIRRMTDDGPRVYPELAKRISDLREEIKIVATSSETGETFEERDEARLKLDGLKEELSLEEASLGAVRYLIESQKAASPRKLLSQHSWQPKAN